jgi:hypothetical protein
MLSYDQDRVASMLRRPIDADVDVVRLTPRQMA